jgi:predicted dehydrogenase
MAKIKLGIVGIGKIARDQHLPVLAASTDFELVAAASRNATVKGVASYSTLEAMLAAHPEIEAISLCTPPGPREADARLALSRGLHVLLEKPPAVSLTAARDLIARAQGATLCASWHSRHAPGVPAARDWLSQRRVRSVAIVWKEDIRRWHPGQDWILDAGGMGVFDPTINALSIVTHILASEVALLDAELDVPSNRQAPIAARLRACSSDGAEISADVDFLQEGPQTWDITIETDAGLLRLTDGGARIFIGAEERNVANTGRHHEYTGVYAHFAALVRARMTDVDLRPLELVADAFLAGRRRVAPAFAF